MQGPAREIIYKTLLFYIPIEAIMGVIIPLLIGRLEINGLVKAGIAGLFCGAITSVLFIKLTIKRFIHLDSEFKTYLKEWIQKYGLYSFIRLFRIKSIILGTVISVIVLGPLMAYALSMITAKSTIISVLCMGVAGFVSSVLHANYVTRRFIIPMAEELNLSNAGSEQ